ncbi:MAG: hypothetical protein J6W41_01035 [Alphaproteobacteria bacterium]|nr:hypothetical protein [Alphaproteobacteria bacterium]
MNKVKYILIGFCMLVVMLGLVFFTGAIYDAENKNKIETYFFEPNNKSSDRISIPLSPDNMTQNALREKIVEHFLYEYFYVIPDENNARMRTMDFRNTDGTPTPLGAIVRERARTQWATNVGPDIMDLATKHGMRTVELLGISESESGHLVVDYKLKTWNQSNDVLARPIETTGRLLLYIENKPITVKQTQETLDYLQRGVDPVSAFDFYIHDVIQE